MIEITERQINRINTLLATIPEGAKKAYTGVFGRALSTVKAQTYRQISEVYAITRANLRMDSNVKLKQVTSDEAQVVGKILFGSFAIPLYRFTTDPRQPTPRENQSVSVGVMKGTKERLDNAFVAKMKSGHMGVFERLPGEYMNKRTGKTKHSERIGAEGKFGRRDQFYGPSMSQMAQNAAVLQEIEAAAQETINKRVEQEISRILNGYGI